jgi:hypothetical protein
VRHACWPASGAIWRPSWCAVTLAAAGLLISWSLKTCFCPLFWGACACIFGIPDSPARDASAVFLVLVLPNPEAIPSFRTQTLWAPAFFLSETISVAFFLVSSSLAAANLISAREPLPYTRLAAWGFIVFTLCQIIGGVWAYLGWSSPFSWSDRHLVSAAVWCLFAAVLHADAGGIQPRTKAVCAALGIIPVVYLAFSAAIADAFAKLIKVLS